MADRLRTAAKEGKKKTFEDQVAMVVNMLRVFMCDIMFLSCQRAELASILAWHRDTLRMFDLLLLVCKEPTMLVAWLYTEDRQRWVVQRIGQVVGAGDRVSTILISSPSELYSRGKHGLPERIEDVSQKSPILEC